MKAFKAYDIRGVYGEDFNGEDVYRIGFHLPSLLKADSVLVGRDVRSSSDEIFRELCRGINDAGADVHDAGLATTPMVYWGTAKFGFDASVQITASHNPARYNGLKVSRTGALPVGYDTGLSELEKMLEKPVSPVSTPGTVKSIDVKSAYIEYMKKFVTDLSGLSMAVDCSNGMASILVHELLGEKPIYLFDTLDGTFPNHEPNPLEEKNVEPLKKAVLENRSDVGVIYDGDADRVMFVDEKGAFVPPDLIIGLMAHHFLKDEKGNVLMDIRTSKSVAEYIEKLGGTPHMWKVGHAFAKLKMRELKAVFGGELAGHYYIRDFYNCDSGILASLIVLEVIAEAKRGGRSFSELIEGIRSYANSGEINFRIEKKQEAMDTLKNRFMDAEKATAFYDFDGYRIEFPLWWFNVRPSNTEPYLRLVVEAKTEDLLNEKLAEIRTVLADFA
jgi:phosphomannomutase